MRMVFCTCISRNRKSETGTDRRQDLLTRSGAMKSPRRALFFSLCLPSHYHLTVDAVRLIHGRLIYLCFRTGTV